jgi:hypothetical protein
MGDSLFSRTAGARGRNSRAEQVQFSAIEQLPLDGFTGLQTNGSGQCQRKTDIQAWLLAARADDLDLQWVGGRHIFEAGDGFFLVKL